MQGSGLGERLRTVPFPSTGTFDSTSRFHLCIPDLGIVLEFKAGCVIFLPSALLRHFNVHSEDLEVRETKAGETFMPGEGELRGSIVLFSQANVFMLAETGHTATSGKAANFPMKCKWTLDHFKSPYFSGAVGTA